MAIANGSIRHRARCLLMMLCLAIPALSAAQSPGPSTDAPLTVSVSKLQETAGTLTLRQALAAAQQGAFRAVPGNTPRFGIGVPAAWIRMALVNPNPVVLQRRLSIDITWLDHVDIDLVQ